METISILEHARSTWEGMIAGFFGAIPRIVVGLMVVVFALIVAKTISIVLRAVLRRSGFDALPARYGMDTTFKRFGIEEPLSSVLPRVVYWLMLFLFAQTAADALGLEPISSAIGGFLAFLPNLVTALLLLLIGSSAGQFIGAAVTRSARESGIDYSSALGNIVSVLVVFIAGVMAVAQLKINIEIIRIVTFCGLAGAALAFGLSFGLGTQDVTRNIVAGFYARKLFRAGESLEVGDSRGTLKAITPLQTVIEVDGREHAVANSVFLDQLVRR